MAALYNEKCDKCGKERPEYFVQVNKTLTTSGGVGSESQFWCMECIRGKSVESDEWVLTSNTDIEKLKLKPQGKKCEV